MGRGYARVDDADHAGLAVGALGAVVPDGLGVVDHDGVGGHHGIGRLDGHVAREQAFGHGRARAVEGGLHDGMVLHIPIS